MEDNNRKGPGIFYAVVGVATLVVAIIGATFAFFSASAESTGDTITGGTNNELAAALKLSVYKLDWTDNGGATSNDLVPADFGDTEGNPRDLSTDEVQGALNAKCVNAGYTGCHLWKIDATTTQTIANASVVLDLSVSATDKANWRYAIFTATGEAVAGDVTNPSITVNNFATVGSTVDGVTHKAQGNLSTAITGLDMHNNAAMSAGTVDDDGNVTKPSNNYYLLVYLANVNNSQNAQGVGSTSETGTYTGTVTMNAAGGQVSATFTAAQ